MVDAGMINYDVVARREVAADMAEAARAWLDTLDAEQRTLGQGAGSRRRSIRERTPPLVLHPD